jgi:fatty acid desaturase
LVLIALCMLMVARGWLSGCSALLVVPVIGFSFAGITFLGHETLHGAVVRGKLARRLVGFIGFVPFTISPKLWVRWHNQTHHGNANRPEIDPDAYPTLASYRARRQERWMIDRFSVGRKRMWGILTLLLGFSVHSFHILLSSRRTGMLSPAEHRVAVLETVLGAALWSGVLVLVGPVTFLYVYVGPLMIANGVVMAYILTNHSLSPHTSRNDPLANSLSVTVPRFIDWLTLGFGFHVEHHIFPWMSPRHARSVRALLRERWPERYQSMPLFKALWQLHCTVRIYKDDVTLIDPRTGEQWKTLLPRA